MLQASYPVSIQFVKRFVRDLHGKFHLWCFVYWASFGSTRLQIVTVRQDVFRVELKKKYLECWELRLQADKHVDVSELHIRPSAYILYIP